MKTEFIKLLRPFLFILFILLHVNCDYKQISELEENHPEDNSKYGFEIDEMGWETSSYNNEKAIIAVNQTNTTSYLGSGSLMMVVDLEGGNSPKNCGVAWVNWELYPPPYKLNVPVNLSGSEISAQIFATKGAEGTIEGSENVIALNIWDKNWKYKSGVYKKIEENKWFEISVSSDTTKNTGEYIEPGFDPKAIVEIQVRIFVQADSSYHYIGCLYMDAVDW